MADLLSANLPFELFWGHPNEVPLAIIFLFFQETTTKTTVVMNQQPHTTATPEQDLMITQEMVINKVMNTLDVYGLNKAIEKIDDFRKALSDFPGWRATEAKLEEIIKAYRKEEEKKARELEQKNLNQMAMYMTSMANQTATQQPAAGCQEPIPRQPPSDKLIRRCLELLMEKRDTKGKPLFRNKDHWQAVFCILAGKLHFNRNDFEFFDVLMKRIIPDKVNAHYSRSAVKNISQTPYFKPLEEWEFDEKLMKTREPFERMQDIAEYFQQLLETTPED